MQRLTGAVIKLPEQVFVFQPSFCQIKWNHPNKPMLTFNNAGHLNWWGDQCSHHWTFLLDPVGPAPHPRNGCRTPRRSRSLHPGTPTPQWRGDQHLAHATSLLCRRAAAALVDVQESQLENLLKIGCLALGRPTPDYPLLQTGFSKKPNQLELSMHQKPWLQKAYSHQPDSKFQLTIC